MDGLTSIAGGWSSTPGWFHTIIYSGAGIVVGGAIGLIVCAKTESCKSKFPNLFKKDSENGSANQSLNPSMTSSTPVNSTPNQKTNTQGGRQTRRVRKYRQSTSKRICRSRK